MIKTHSPRLVRKAPGEAIRASCSLVEMAHGEASSIFKVVRPDAATSSHLSPVRPMGQPTGRSTKPRTAASIQLGELHVDILLLPPGEGRSCCHSVPRPSPVCLSITEVVVRLDFDTELRADIAEKPFIDLDDEFLEVLIGLIPMCWRRGATCAGRPM